MVPGPKLGPEGIGMNLNQSLSAQSSQTSETGVLLKYDGMLRWLEFYYVQSAQGTHRVEHCLLPAPMLRSLWAQPNRSRS